MTTLLFFVIWMTGLQSCALVVLQAGKDALTPKSEVQAPTVRYNLSNKNGRIDDVAIASYIFEFSFWLSFSNSHNQLYPQ